MSIARLTDAIEDILSFSKDALVSTTYDDDYSIRGKKFFYENTLSFTGNETKRFLFDMSKCECDIIFAPISGTAIGEKVVAIIYEDTDYTGGTELQFYNTNRNHLDVYNPVVTVGASGSDTGTQLRKFQFPAASTGANINPASGISNLAMILNNNKKYLITLTSADTTEFDIRADFYDPHGGI